MNFELCLKKARVSSVQQNRALKSRVKGRNIVECHMIKSGCTPCCMLMQVVGSCCAKVETGQNLSQQLKQHFFCSVITEG